eukprot:14489639-Alexandrium_andersonii.AAC.1
MCIRDSRMLAPRLRAGFLRRSDCSWMLSACPPRGFEQTSSGGPTAPGRSPHARPREAVRHSDPSQGGRAPPTHVDICGINWSLTLERLCPTACLHCVRCCESTDATTQS